MKFIADFHIHSKYSRATSPTTNIENLSLFAKLKGIDLLGTGDFTHPSWLNELKNNLNPIGNGLFKYNEIFFILTVEVCNLFNKNGKGKKNHNLIFAPSFEIVEKINKSLAKYGNLSIDGRPMLSLSSANLVKILMNISEDIMIIPAHIWTPWFSLFGSKSGFDQIEECFEDQTKYIYALETGLSSDPSMNWMLSKLDKYTLISNSDAHSPSKLGREANVFNAEMDYFEIKRIFQKKDKEKFLFTLEFFPEEGKYHYDGHRVCNIRFSPEETLENNNICPVCKKNLTIGVMNRINFLSDRKNGIIPSCAIPFKKIIPLKEIISEVLQVGIDTNAVNAEYKKIIQCFGTEFNTLLDVSEKDLKNEITINIAEAIIKVRNEKVKIIPGYDGVFGEIHIQKEKEKKKEAIQLNLF
ncbi:MAG: endonuclease Q family protein [bacterium]